MYRETIVQNQLALFDISGRVRIRPMEEPGMYSRGFLARQNIEEARQSSNRLRQKLFEENDVNRLSIERFFNTLTLVAGGTLALSLTYLGYLKTATGGQPTHLWTLKTSWGMLLACLAFSVFYNNFHTRYVAHARLREYAASMKAQRKADIEGADKVPVIDYEGKQWDSGELKTTLTKEMEKFESDVQWHKKRENFYAGLYAWDARAAQSTFILGLAFLLAFAFLNT
jgi:hypothetical protein